MHRPARPRVRPEPERRRGVPRAAHLEAPHVAGHQAGRQQAPLWVEVAVLRAIAFPSPTAPASGPSTAIAAQNALRALALLRSRQANTTDSHHGLRGQRDRHRVRRHAGRVTGPRRRRLGWGR